MPVNIIDTIKPKNGLNFPVVEAIDVFVEDYENLADAISHFATDAMIAAINAVLSGKANTSDVNTAVSGLQAQIDNLITPVTQDAEVQNARVGADGTSYSTLKARLDAADAKTAAVKADIDDAVDEIIARDYEDLEADGSTTYDRTYSGYFSPGGFVSDPAFTSYLLHLTKDTTFYCKSKNENYFSICIYDSSDFTGGTRYRYNASTSEDTLPYAADPLPLSKGQYLTLTVKNLYPDFVAVLTDYELVSKTLDDDVILDAAQINQIKRGIAPDFAAVTTVASDMIYDESSEYSATYDGYFGPNGFTEDPAYISYLIRIERNATLYCADRNETYFSICVYDSLSFTGGTRYRYKTGETDTLPYAANPLTLSKDQYVVFTTSVNATEFSVELPNYNMAQTLTEAVRLNTSQIDQIKNDTSLSSCYLIYHNSDTGIFTEAVDIFISAKVGYVRYHFAHGVSQNIHANIWRITAAYAADKNFVDRYALTTSGEWELAVLPDGAPDFAGGTAHGDQIMDSITWFVDGNKVDISNYTELTAFNNFKVVETSALYNPSEPEVQMATVGSEHIWTSEKLTINQSVLWDLDEEMRLSSAYLGMHLPAKAITDHFYTDASIAPLACIGNYSYYQDVKRAVIYGDSSGVSTEFWNTEYPTGYTGEGTFRFTDNNGGAYNKGYFVVVSGDPDNVIPVGQTLWKSSVHYKFEIGK